MSFQDRDKDPYFVSTKAILFSVGMALIVISLAFYGIFVNPVYSPILIPIMIIFIIVQIAGYFYINKLELDKRSKPSKFWWSNEDR